MISVVALLYSIRDKWAFWRLKCFLYKGLGFIDCMCHLSSSTNVEMIYADKRYYDEGFGDFFCFLNALAKVEEGIIEAYIKYKKLTPNSIPFFSKSTEFIHSINELSDRYEKKYNAADW